MFRTAHFHVGNGDMTLIRLPSGRTLLVDINIRGAGRCQPVRYSYSVDNLFFSRTIGSVGKFTVAEAPRSASSSGV